MELENKAWTQKGTLRLSNKTKTLQGINRQTKQKLHTLGNKPMTGQGVRQDQNSNKGRW